MRSLTGVPGSHPNSRPCRSLPLDIACAKERPCEGVRAKGLGGWLASLLRESRRPSKPGIARSCSGSLQPLSSVQQLAARPVPC